LQSDPKQQLQHWTILRKRTIAKRSQTAAGAQDDPKKKDNSKAIPNSGFMDHRTVLRKRSSKGRLDDKMKK
jgi:hypothetical protein